MFIPQTEHIRDWPEIKRLFDEDAVQVIKPPYLFTDSLICNVCLEYVFKVLQAHLTSEILKKKFHFTSTFYLISFFFP